MMNTNATDLSTRPLIDNARWHAAHQELRLRVLALKELRREPHQPRWCSPLPLELAQLKTRLTALYWVRAWSRGRQHCPNEHVADYTVQQALDLCRKDVSKAA